MATVKHISYAGITLLLPTPELEAGWLARTHPPYDFTDFDGYNFEYPNAPAVPTPPRPRPTDFRLNVLTFPTAASRPAWFHFVCETSRLEAIQTAVGSTATLALLVMFDGRTGKTITVQMTIVGARPFNVTVGNDDETFYLVTLSDIRYLWYMKRNVVTTPSSWSDLFTQIGNLLGTVISVDTVDPAYGTPSEKWATAYNNPTALLDAAAYQVGQRTVVGTDGSVSTLNWETAKSTSDAYLTNNPHVLSGGHVATDSLTRAAPAACVTVFSDVSSGSPSLIPFAVTNTLVSLAIPQYGSATGLSGYHDTVFADTAYDGTNAAACNAYAAAAAEDTYGWRLSDPDVAYPGIEPWEPTGWEERVEWTMTVRGDGPFARTTVRRGPWKEFHRDGLFPSVNNDCVDDCYFDYNASGCLTLNVSGLAGRGLTASGTPCQKLNVDLQPASYASATYLTNVTINLSGGFLTLYNTYCVQLVGINQYGMPVSYTNQCTGDPVPVSYIDVCLFAECCDASGPTADASVDGEFPQAVAGETEVGFLGFGVGGVGTYTYLWDFDDGFTSTDQNPTHVFDCQGVYEVTLTVTDSCGRTGTDTVFVYVHGPQCGTDCVGEGNTFGPALRFEMTLTDGDGDFTGANGLWRFFYVGPPDDPCEGGACLWYGDMGNGWTGILQIGPPFPTVPEIVLTNGTASLTYLGDSPGSPVFDNCTGTNMMTGTSIGTGTEPTPSDLVPFICETCDFGCDSYTVGGTSVVRDTATTWSGSGISLVYDGDGAWTVTLFSGCVYTTTGWDGTGCRTFDRTGGTCDDSDPLTIEVCCVSS